MVKVLMSCFLSVICTGATVCDAMIMPLEDITFSTEEIDYEEIETKSYRVGFIGRHDFLKVLSCDENGYQNIQNLTFEYSTSALTNFEFRDTYETVETTAVSTTEALSQENTIALNIKLGLEVLNVSASFEYKEVYTISNTKTYTISTTERRELKYDLREEYAQPGHKFKLCMAAKVYEITYKTWSVDNYWWGDYIVSGTEIEHTAYVTVSPFVTIVFDGELIL